MIDTKIKLENYVIVDIENPNTKANSICSIAFIQVENEKIINEKYTLINPESSFDNINIGVNKITPNMVKDSITFDKYWNKYKSIFEDSIIVGHGIKYDLSVISKALANYKIDIPPLKCICTQKLSKKYLETDKYSLDNVCEYLNINLDNHHNAMCDTNACNEIFKYINDNFGIDSNDIEIYKYKEGNNSPTGIKITYSDDTKGLQKLKRIIELIMEDKVIEQKEIGYLNNWLDENNYLIGNYPFDKIYAIVKNVLDDGIITKEEHSDLIRIFEEFLNPVSTQDKKNDILFDNKLFCLTGTFNSGTKEDIEQKIVNKGGICGKGVTSKTDYLIVGGAGSDAWKFGNYGGKVQRAMELKEKGKKIEIIGEEDFIILL